MKKLNYLILFFWGLSAFWLNSCKKDNHPAVYLPTNITAYSASGDSIFYSLTYDSDNRLEQIFRSNNLFATFTYNGDTLKSFTLAGDKPCIAQYSDGHLSAVTSDNVSNEGIIKYDGGDYSFKGVNFSFNSAGDIESMNTGEPYKFDYSNSPGPFQYVNMPKEAFIFLASFTDIYFDLGFLTKKELTQMEMTISKRLIVVTVTNLNGENGMISSSDYLEYNNSRYLYLTFEY